MDAIRVASQQGQTEAVRGRPSEFRPRPQAPPGEAEQAAASPARAERADIEAVAQKLATRFDLKVEVVRDDKTGQDILRVMSPDGKRLLRQFPPEAVLALAERLDRGATDGLLTSLA